nr:hypothetical protein BaRGS_016799 [Batillaria attramentaria]
MLERAKRRAGVRNSGTGNHVNLPLAWTELAQIAQCKGTVQEECLDVLIASLDVSPLAKYHIPALFFLAETMLYWLRTDAVHQPYLRTGEIKLLRMGQLVFQRLFYHHMAGQLQGHSDFKNRLFTYTDGLAECQEAYNPYPNALLSMRFIIEVSKIILADTVVEPGEVKEGDNLPDAPRLNTDEMESVTKEMYERELRDVDTHSSHSGAISSSVHDLSPTLWHALDVWRCTNSLSGGLREALKALAHCGLGLASETWVDGVIALNILAETAKSNMAAMKVLHRLAQGVKTTEDLMTPPLSSRSGHSDMFSISSNDDEMMLKQSDSRGSYLSSKPSLSDIYERSDEGDPEKKVGSSASATGISSASNSYNLGNSQTSTQDSLESQKEDVDELYGNQDGDASKPKPVLKEPASGHKPLKSREVSFDETSIAVKERNLNHGDQGVLPKKNVHGGSKGSRQKQESHPSTKGSSAGDGVPGTGFQPEVGSDFFTSRGSDASSAPTFTNLPLPETPGINGWHWEVAFTYTDMLADICINGKTANIQKMALVGNNVNMMEPYRRIVTTVQLPSAGLLDLAVFHALNEADDGGPNDWSWRIRYGAIQSLVKVVRSLEGDKAREGLRSAAWNALLKAHSSEKDGRVLEALKVGQVHTDIQGILGKDSSTTSIGSRVAAGLSVIYLPPLPPPVDMSMPRPTHSRRHINVMKPPPAHTTRQRQPLRTSLKEELDLATSLYEPPVDFNTRTSFDLRRIVEDQWRKELQKQLEEEEEKRQKDLEQKQKDEEEIQRMAALASWLHSVNDWYPDLHTRTYFVPPLHFNRVSYDVQTVAGQSVLVPKVAPSVPSLPAAAAKPASSAHSSSPSQQPLPGSVWPDEPPATVGHAPQIFDCDVRDDRAQQLVLQHIRDLAEREREVMLVLSQLDFRKYLDKQVDPISAAAAALLPRPVTLKPSHRRGDFDVLIIHRQYGMIVGEVKAVGANFSKTQDMDTAVVTRVQKAVKQLNKAEDVLRHLVSDLAPVTITKTLMLPNITSRQLVQALSTSPQIQQNLCQCLNAVDLSVAVERCLCSDQLSSTSWWRHAVLDNGPDVNMTSQLYETLVARFSGPATTIEVPTVTTPCVELRMQSEAIAYTGLRMAILTLYPGQLDLANRAGLLRVYLTGPPGTGKTVVLVIKALQWLQQGKDVHLLSTHSNSRAAIYLIHHQLLYMLGAASPGRRVHAHVFDFLRNEGDVEAAVNTLEAAGKARDGQLYVIADEAWPDYLGERFSDFCTQLTAKVPTVNLWAAAVRRDVIPACLTEERLTTPLRCPPAVVLEVAQSGDIDGSHVHSYTSSATLAPTDGPPVRWLRHQGQPEHEEVDDPQHCERCGHAIADLLGELRVGLSGQACLQYRDILILARDPRGDLAVVRGLRARGVPVQVVTLDDRDAAC